MARMLSLIGQIQGRCKGVLGQFQGPALEGVPLRGQRDFFLRRVLCYSGGPRIIVTWLLHFYYNKTKVNLRKGLSANVSSYLLLFTVQTKVITWFLFIYSAMIRMDQL